MRHRNAGRQFSRNTSHRKAMFRALTANLVAHERIETTDAKAKELKRKPSDHHHAVRLGDVAYTPQGDVERTPTRRSATLPRLTWVARCPRW